jgi:26S proteasome regulatory subunit N10
MVLEATVVCLDNSDWMRNGDYTPTRLEAQQDAINLIAGAKTQQNPENTVGALAGAGKSPEVLVTLTSDLGKILSSLHGTKIGGKFDFLGAIQVAQLVLKHRQNKNQHQRVIVFVGSPITADQDSLVRLAKRLKKNNIAVDIVNFGEEAENTEKLEAFIAAVNNNDNSHLVTVPPGPHILSDILISSPLITGEEGGAPGAMGGAGGDFGGFGVDPNLEPELALALKVSMEEERARQEAARKAEAAKTETPSQPTTAAQAPSTEVQMGEAEMDEDLLQAIALSMQAEKATAPTPAAPTPITTPTPIATPTVPTTTTRDVQMEDDEDLRLAMEMSMQAAPAPSQATAQQTTQQKPAEGGDLSAAMNDPSFVNSLLASLPGVDPDDERIKNALKQLEKKDK